MSVSLGTSHTTPTFIEFVGAEGYRINPETGSYELV